VGGEETVAIAIVEAGAAVLEDPVVLNAALPSLSLLPILEPLLVLPLLLPPTGLGLGLGGTLPLALARAAAAAAGLLESRGKVSSESVSAGGGKPAPK